MVDAIDYWRDVIGYCYIKTIFTFPHFSTSSIDKTSLYYHKTDVTKA